MLDKVFVRAQVIARLQQGPPGPYLEELATTLHQQGYAPSSIRLSLGAGDKFGRWLQQQGLTAAAADDATVERYLSRFKPYRSGNRAKAVQGLTHVVKLLRQHGVAAVGQPEEACSEVEAWLIRYETYLEQVAGVAPGTRRNYRRLAQYFMSARFGTGAVDWSALTAHEVADFVRQQAAARQRCGKAAPAVAMRSLLRFLVFQGAIEPNLAGAVPTVRQWTHAALPKRLTPPEVSQVLAAVQGETPKARRDYAILLLLARLGLRAREVAELRLEDIDWREGRLLIRPGKTHQERVLPLAQDVGEALAAYLAQGRPKSPSRRVFLHSRPPFQPFARAAAVGEIAQEALRRAGVSLSPGMGAHTFRHTVASALVCQGASFKDVADVLGHQSLQSTAIYAKLDLEALAEVALPWAGGES